MSQSGWRVKVGPSIVVLLSLTLCMACMGSGPKSQTGAVAGAAAGGLLAAAVTDEAEGIIAGVLLGALVGGAIGDSLDQRDRAYAQRNAQYALERTPSGTTSEWRNPDSGHSGTTMPVRTYRAPSGTYCREFQQTITVGGRTEQAYGTACRQPDGSWQIQ